MYGNYYIKLGRFLRFFWLKGLAKLGNIVAETDAARRNVSQFSHARKIVVDATFASVTQENVFESSQKHFGFKDANVVSVRNICFLV